MPSYFMQLWGACQLVLLEKVEKIAGASFLGLKYKIFIDYRLS